MFVCLRLGSWEELAFLSKALSPFVFRGQSDSSWDLTTSIERCFRRFEPETTYFENAEHWILREFERKYHLYASHPPSKGDYFEWLSILQHHGCPTRLFDFTMSLYIAAYFAVIDATADSAIWAINLWNLRERIRHLFDLPYEAGMILKDRINAFHVGLANEFIADQRVRKEKKKAVIYAEPVTFTQRLSSQQGLFLLPTDLSEGFMANLCSALEIHEGDGQVSSVKSLLGIAEEWDKLPSLIKLIVPRELHDDGLQELARMNITAETLFPGLDGLARSFVQTQIRI